MELGNLEAFCNKVMSVEKDYDLAVHAVAVCAFAAATAAGHLEGITGFQAGCVMWEFIRKWMHKDAPLRLIDYGCMMYPQYAEDFDKTIHPETFKWMQEQAAKRLAKGGQVHPSVKAHWESIVNGVVPFGYTIKES